MSGVLNQIAASLYEGDAEQAAALTQQALDQGLSPGEILSGGLVAGMDEVGRGFKSGELFVPEMLIAGRAMHAGMDVLRPLLTKSDVHSTGKFLIGTVAGDLHDIGKNLVRMMVEGAGFETVDLGTDVPTYQFVKAVREHHPNLLGMSALLTTTMPAMKEAIEALEEAGLRDQVKVLVGGAPVTAAYAEQIGADGSAPDAAAAVEVSRELTAEEMAVKPENAPYLNAGLSISVRVEDLLQQMTLEEKANEMNLVVDLFTESYRGQMNVQDILQMVHNFGIDARLDDLQSGLFKSPGGSIWTTDGEFDVDQARNTFVEMGRAHVYGLAAAPTPRDMAGIANQIQEMVANETRLGIPPLLSSEGLHGHIGRDATMFPQAIGMASTWDPELIEEIGSAIAAEARAVGIANVWHPVLDVARDPRWGRTEETYGEDPYLVSRLGVAMVKGMQGDDVSAPDKVVATLKHFGGHGGPLGGRDSNMEGMTERDLREIHLVPFQAAVEEAGALSIMPAYHAIDGIPCHANHWLLRQVLLNEWGFQGYTVSDASAVEHLHTKHFVATDQKEAIKLVVEAGLDVHNNGAGFVEPLVELVREGIVDEAVIDEAVRHILAVKFKLGLFDNRTVDPDRAAATVRCDEHLTLALKAAREAIVLLKNEDKTLPLSKDLQSILVIGHNSDNPTGMLGGYSYPSGAVTILQGIQAKVGQGVEVKHVVGGKVWESTDEEIAEAVEAAQGCDLAILVAGDLSTWGTNASSGEGVDRALLDLPGRQQELLEAIHATGTPVVLVLVNGRPASVRWAAENLPAIVEAWYPGCEGGHAVADVLFGDYNPGGKLPITFPKHSGQLPLFYNQKPSGRHIYYRDTGAEPLYPFGFGLSYTEFAYSNLEIAPAQIRPAGQVTVSVDVQNSGAVAGDEVVQLYINDLVSSMVTPLIELKGFQRLSLEPGEKQRVTFTLTPQHLALLDRHLEKVVEPGTFEVMVGSSSTDIRLRYTFEVIN